MTSDGILLNNAISNFDLSALGEGGGSGSRSANQGILLDGFSFGGFILNEYLRIAWNLNLKMDSSLILEDLLMC